MKLIRVDNSFYAILPVPKQSSDHRLSFCNLSECYLTYWVNENHHVLTPYKFYRDSKILGFASTLHESIKRKIINIIDDPVNEFLVIEIAEDFR